MRRLVTLVSFLMLSAPTLAADLVIDQIQPNSSAIIADFTQEDLAQSFQPSVSPISGAGVVVKRGGPQDVTIQLWSKLPNQMGAQMLAQGTAQGINGEWVDVFWSPVVVTPGTTYFLVFLSDPSMFGVAGDTMNPYPRGNAYANTGFQPQPTFDYAFRTWTNGTLHVPALGAVGLCLVAGILFAGGVGLVRRRKAVSA